MKYISVTVETTTEASDIVSLILIDEGTEGVSVIDPADIDYIKERVYWDYAGDIPIADSKVYVTGVYEEGKDLNSLKNALADFKKISESPTGSLDIKTAILDSADYEDEWKKYYNIIEIASLAVVPAWMEYNGNNTAVKINPGKAFGTGSHETTSMCLELLQDFKVQGKNVIDVGCGSGILGLSAITLGAESAYMSDIDIQAIEAANENAAINNLQDKTKIVLWGEKEITEFFSTDCNNDANNKDIDKIILFGENKSEKADICLANLTADILIRLKPNLTKLVKKGGSLIISGIINERAEEIIAVFSNFTKVNHAKNGQWQAFSFIA